MGLPKKGVGGGAWTVCRFTVEEGGSWQESGGGGVFEGGVHTPVHTMFSRIETSVGFLFGFSEKLQNVYLHFVFQS